MGNVTNRLTIHGKHVKEIFKIPSFSFIESNRKNVSLFKDSEVFSLLTRLGNNEFVLSFVSLQEINKLKEKLEGHEHALMFENRSGVFSIMIDKSKIDVNFKATKELQSK